MSTKVSFIASSSGVLDLKRVKDGAEAPMPQSSDMMIKIIRRVLSVQWCEPLLNQEYHMAVEDG